MVVVYTLGFPKKDWSGEGIFSVKMLREFERICSVQTLNAARGGNARGGTWLSGPEILGPLSGLGIRPLVSAIRVLGSPLPKGPSEPRKGSSGASERCVSFQQSHSEAPKRSRFP